MRKFLTKIAFTATLGFALALTFSCGLHGTDGDDETNSSSSGGGKSSSGGSTFVGEKGTFKDARDDQEYKWVKIGTQTWMAQNLNYKETPVNPASTKRSSQCYDDKEVNCEKYGRLYEWYDAVEVCPSGWHLPTKAEWEALISFVGKDPGQKLKAADDWRDGNGTDYYGFGALPGGTLTDEFKDRYIAGYWWTATVGSYTSQDWYFSVSMNSGDNVNLNDYGQDNTNKYSVRCIEAN